MKKRAIGRTGVEVGALGLGGMLLSIEERPTEAQAIRVIHTALDYGVRLIDTADVYCLGADDIGHNERLIAAAIKTWRGSQEVFVATKGGLIRPEGRWEVAGSPAQLTAACEASREALGVDEIFLYQLHAPDEAQDFEAQIEALAELRQRGVIGHVGLSNVSLEEIKQARAIVPITSVQNRCNPFERRAFDDGIVDYCAGKGITFLPYSPVGGRYGKQRTADDPTLKAVGGRHGVSPFRVALAWLLHRSPAIIPIPSCRRLETLLDSVKAPELQLTAEDIDELDRAFPS